MTGILVTGGAGFIGSHLSKRLLSRGLDVTIIDNLSSGSYENIPANANFQNLDMASDDWTKLIKGTFDTVYHLAAQSSGEISFEDPIQDAKININGTLSLLQWCKTKKVKNFVFASSMNTYGDVPDKAIAESTPSAPKSFYGIAKIAAENYVRLFNSDELKTTCLRLFNVYGPGQNLSNLKQGMLSIYCSYILNKRPIAIKGPLNRFRDFIFIDDVVNALELMLENRALDPVYNVCSGQKTTVKQAVDKIIEAFGFSDYPIELLEGTPGDQFGIYGCNRLITRSFNWTPRLSFDEGIQQFVEHIQKNESPSLK